VQTDPSDLAEVPTLLTGDETACSFASEPVYDLTNNLQSTTQRPANTLTEC